jgi:hypothetical protein
MTLEEKRSLKNSISKLSSKHMETIAEIICQNLPNIELTSGEVEIDIGTLDNKTLWKLYTFIEQEKQDDV